MRDIFFLGASKSEIKGREEEKKTFAPETNPENIKIDSNLHGSQEIVQEFALKKVSLLATVASLLHEVKQPYLHIYELYIHHIEKMFGKDSL